MKTRLIEENTAAEDLLPPKRPDGSGIGVNYVDAYLKAMNAELDDGTPVKCKRKGIKIILQIGDAKGEALMNRFTEGPEPQVILRRALEAAAQDAGARFVVEDSVIYLEE